MTRTAKNLRPQRVLPVHRPAASAAGEFVAFLARLVQCAKVYSELVLVKAADTRINRHLRNLRMIKAVQTTGS